MILYGSFFVNSLYVQIDTISDLSLRCIAPVDTCPAFAVKRRSFLLVINIRGSQAERLATFLRLYSLIAGFERVGSRLIKNFLRTMSRPNNR